MKRDSNLRSWVCGSLLILRNQIFLPLPFGRLRFSNVAMMPYLIEDLVQVINQEDKSNLSQHSLHSSHWRIFLQQITFFFFFLWSLYSFSFKRGKKKVKIHTNYSLLLCVGLNATVRIQCDDWTFEVNFLGLQCSKISCIFSILIADTSASLFIFFRYPHTFLHVGRMWYAFKGECYVHSERYHNKLLEVLSSICS